MAWEQLYKAFPTGMTEFDETGLISIKNLQEDPDIEVVSRTRVNMARDMIISETREVFGKNGEFAIVNEYDVYNGVFHPDPDNIPLNVYGMAMINDYLTYHDVNFESHPDDTRE